jgi:transposase
VAPSPLVAYATDLTDSQWRLVPDLFDPPGRRGQPRVEPLVNGIQRRHKVTVTIKGWRKPNKPKGFKPIRPLWKVEDCFAQLGRWRRLSRSFEATAESAGTWLHVACVGYLLTKV